MPSGNGAAVVSIDWPGRQLGHEGPAAVRVELGEHVVEQQRRAPGRSAPDQLVDAQPQGQGQAALLPLRGVGPGLAALEHQDEFVAVRADRVHAPPQVVVPAGRERVEEVALPAALGRAGDQGRRSLRRPGGCRRRHQGLEIRHQPFPGRHEHLAGVGQALVPHVERGRHVLAHPAARLTQQGGPLAQHPVAIVRRPRPFGIEQGQRVVEQVAPALGAAADEGQVLGEKIVHGTAARQILARRGPPCG